MNCCTPLSMARPQHRIIVGFDIETQGKFNKFVCCTFSYSTISYDQYINIKDALNHLQNPRFLNGVVVATNLMFDLFGFIPKSMFRFIHPLFRDGRLISARIYQDVTGKWVKDKTKNFLDFVDTINYLPASVESLGKILGREKLTSPTFLGKTPKNKSEWKELLVYNERDSSISREFYEFLYCGFLNENTRLKFTIASTSIDNWRRNYLDGIIYQQPREVLLEQLNAYYGGRTEAFKRGKVHNANYYDFNSLYPSVMVQAFPHPNSFSRLDKGEHRIIEEFEGISEVIVECPNIKIPLLPVRSDKIIFPRGIFKGWYSHIELRKALEIGYIIHFVGIQHFYKQTFYPFKEFVTDNYNKRLEAKKKNNNMQLLYKLLMNSLYGKFAQKFEELIKVVHKDNLELDMIKDKEYDVIEDWVLFPEENDKIPSFVNPIFSIYTTSYARIKLFDALQDCDPIYCDTDSIITTDKFPTSDKLGDLKLEYKVKSGVIVRPKFYSLIKVIDGKEVEVYRIKGLMRVKLSFDDILDRLEAGKKIGTERFVKFRQAIRSREGTKLGKLQINQIIRVEKFLGVEDDKRIWDKKFNRNELQDSLPLEYSNI